MLQISWEVFISKIEGQALLLQISKRSAEDTEGNEGKVYHEGEKKKKKTISLLELLHYQSYLWLVDYFITSCKTLGIVAVRGEELC